SFQEYLAADHAVRESLSGQLAARVSDSWWQEVALLSLRRSKAYCGRFFGDMLASGLAEQHPELAQRCLTESLYFVPEPFVNVLQSSEASVQRKAAVLRLLLGRQKQVPGLGDLCEQFLASKDPALRDLRGTATELLASLGRLPRKGRTPEPFDVVVDGRTGVTFIWIPPGEFRMGSEKQERAKPVHSVRITRGFYLGKYPVTNEQYGRYLQAKSGEVPPPGYWGDRKFNKPKQPVVGVNWREAAAYCEWAGGRLPTEAEWEYCCRAGSEGDYCFGNDSSLLANYAWYYENSGYSTHPVGEKLPNQWGLHDMHGNVWEWCQDWYGGYGKRPQQDPSGSAEGRVRVLRGGSWVNYSVICSAWCRIYYTPEDRSDHFGFRLARTLPPDP
ncbi:MAG TPA: hypothetical protein DCX79_21320, partial [Planctomycetaceae bacterium]|nr:hypothetical protein [Planctomycetaceae bacterium]